MAGDTLGQELLQRVFEVPDTGGRIFAIGPFATRLNFHRQQNRALNLVWALKQSQNGRYHGKNVAVVGAGLAGVTAAAALLGISCDVTAYEACSRVMNRQRLTSHRIAHPNVNYWPNVDTLEPSTDLPFFNWMAADCASIATDVAEEWKEFEGHLDFRKNKEVLAVEVFDDRVEIRDENGVEAYDYVVFASGFRDEHEVEGVPSGSYWATDLPDPPKPGEPPYFVSGTGDGGLIDALRLAHDDYAFGRLIIELAERLSTPTTMTRIANEEASIAARARNRRSEAVKAGATFDPRDNPLDDDIATQERADLYNEIVQKLRPVPRGRLDGSLSDCKPAVLLLSALSAPYAANAAPIHKVLLAHAIKAGNIRHVEARIQKGSLPPVLDRAVPPDVHFDPDRTIVRHGADFELGLLDKLPGGLADQFKTQQGDGHDRIDGKHWETSDFVDRRYGPAGISDVEFLRKHCNRAARLGDLIPEIGVFHPYDARHFVYQVNTQDQRLLAGRVIPRTIFGRELIFEGRAKGDALN